MYIRLIQPRHYDRIQGRFRSSCFSNSGNGTGISLVDTECVSRKATPICRHLARYYLNLIGQGPVIYWHVPTDQIDEDDIHSTPSTSGDECHRDLRGFSHGRSNRFFRRHHRWADIHICEDGHPVPILEANSAFLSLLPNQFIS